MGKNLGMSFEDGRNEEGQLPPKGMTWGAEATAAAAAREETILDVDYKAWYEGERDRRLRAEGLVIDESGTEVCGSCGAQAVTGPCEQHGPVKIAERVRDLQELIVYVTSKEGRDIDGEAVAPLGALLLDEG